MALSLLALLVHAQAAENAAQAPEQPGDSALALPFGLAQQIAGPVDVDRLEHAVLSFARDGLVPARLLPPV